MDTKFYVNKDGDYLGGFCGVEPPSGAIEVSCAPDNALQKWDKKNKAWLPLITENK